MKPMRLFNDRGIMTDFGMAVKAEIEPKVGRLIQQVRELGVDETDLEALFTHSVSWMRVWTRLDFDFRLKEEKDAARSARRKHGTQ